MFFRSSKEELNHAFRECDKAAIMMINDPTQVRFMYARNVASGEHCSPAQMEYLKILGHRNRVELRTLTKRQAFEMIVRSQFGSTISKYNKQIEAEYHNLN